MYEQPPFHRLTAAASTFALLSAVPSPPFLYTQAPADAGDAQTVVYELDTEDSEVIDIAEIGDGCLIHVVSPADACEDPRASSFLAQLELRGDGVVVPAARSMVDLGPGEATSVAMHPGGAFALVAAKSAAAPATRPGSLRVVQDGAVIHTVATGECPDSVAISPDGRLAIVACEAEKPDPDDCPGDAGSPDAAGSIDLFDLTPGATGIRRVASVSGEAIAARLSAGDGGRPARPQEVEPEFVAVSPDSRLALVTLQEQSALVTLDLAALRSESDGRRDAAPAPPGLLAGVVLLQHDFLDPRGVVRGAHPDGVAISPRGDIAITANEAHPRGRHLQGISILDLRGGPQGVRVASTHAIFDLDPTLRGPDRPRARQVRAGKKPRAPKKVQLPRLDPEGVALARSGERVLAAVAIERQAPGDGSGSVLILDVTDVLAGRPPVKIDRREVGANPGARPETVKLTANGRYALVASEHDGGSLTLLDLGLVRPRAPVTPAARKEGR